MSLDADDTSPTEDSAEGVEISDRDGGGLAAQWERARVAVFALLLARIGSFHDAEDVLQEVAVSVARDYHKYDPERPCVAWALGVARNQALMYFRKQSRDRLAFGDDMMELIHRQLECISNRELDEQRKALRACVQKLAPDNRQLLRMRYGDSVELGSIATSMGKSIPAIKGQLFRLRKLLHECIRRQLSIENA